MKHLILAAKQRIVAARFSPVLLKKVRAQLSADGQKVGKIKSNDYGGEAPEYFFDLTTTYTQAKRLSEGSVDKNLKTLVTKLAVDCGCKPIKWNATGGGWIFYMMDKSISPSTDENAAFSLSVSFCTPEGFNGNTIRFFSNAG